jgi:iron complex transport system permease protein
MGHSVDPADQRAALVLIDLRMPRTLLAIFVGGSLAVAGAMMQGLFRNPLADPGLVGVSSGATLAAVTFIVLGNTYLGGWQQLMGIYALPVAAFGGGLVATVVLVGVASRHGTTTVATLLLAGIAFGALTGAMTGILAYISNDRELRDLTLWSMGSLSGSSWSKTLAIAPFAVILLVALPGLVRALNGMLLGEAEAYHLGIDLESAKRRVVLLTAMAVGGAVAVAGIIGFVGIVVPHFVRMIAGPDHRVLLPASALLGGVLVLVADSFARVVVAPAELPIGIIMAIIGAPVFLHLVLKRSSSVAL